MKHRHHPNSSISRAAAVLLLTIVLPYLLFSRCSADESSNLRRASRMTDNDHDAAASSPIGMHSQNANEEAQFFHPFSSSTSVVAVEGRDHITGLKVKQLQRRLDKFEYKRKRQPEGLLAPLGVAYTATGGKTTKAPSTSSPTSSLAPSKAAKTPVPSVSLAPTSMPVKAPSQAPTISTSPSKAGKLPKSATPAPSVSVQGPTVSPVPSLKPSSSPSEVPSLAPSEAPSLKPSISPSQVPSLKPSISPSEMPSMKPSVQPTRRT